MYEQVKPQFEFKPVLQELHTFIPSSSVHICLCTNIQDHNTKVQSESLLVQIVWLLTIIKSYLSAIKQTIQKLQESDENENE